MGIVYKALDLKLNRTVALKFLPSELTLSSKDKERFLQEARTASGLDHTNIGVIHGLEETPEGHTFIVMAYYEGLTLAEKVRRGPVLPKEALNIMVQLARGLSEAHEHSIIHRDIKPSNVIITRQNVAKIVDFGLARVASSAATTLTAGPVGTLAYMSPEQVRSEPLDKRTDIWSLGVVMAEMLTGKHPFERENMSAVLLAILEQAPPVEGLDPALAAIVCHALAKDRVHRYGDCRELLADLEACQPAYAAQPSAPSARDVRISSLNLKRALEHASSSRVFATPMGRARRWTIEVVAAVLLLAMFSLLIPAVRQRVGGMLSSSVAEEKHIAVLPFDNIGNSLENEAISEGLQDSLTSKLSNLDGGQQSLWVVPASEVRRRKVADPEAALREFGATLVVKGSLLRDNSGVHLTLNLIRTKDVRQEGSLSLQNQASDFAALQDQAVAGLARLMHVEAPAPPLALRAAQTAAPAAYESYLKALGYMQRYDKPGNLDQAVTALSSAVASDPQFALGYAGLGEAYRLKYQLDKNSKWTQLALANGTKATSLNDALPSAYVTLGRVHDTLGQNDLALSEFQRALQLDSRNADALTGEAHSYEHAGRPGDAEAAYKKAIALRPDYWDGYNSLGLFYDDQGRYEEAFKQLQHAIDLTPDNATAYSNLGAAYVDSADSKNFPQAEAALKKSIELSPSYAAYANLGFLYLSQNRFAEAAATTEKALQLNDKDFIVWANLALAYEGLKNEVQAKAALDKEQTLLEQAAQSGPRDAGVQYRLGQVYARKKLAEKAIARAQSALALAPDDAYVLEGVAEIYERVGDRANALKCIEKALQKGYSLQPLKSDPLFQGLLSDPNFRPSPK